MSRLEFEQWTARYRESVGPAADSCISLSQDLIESKALAPASMDRLLELLRILKGLSADPITMSCAMIHAAGQDKAVDPVIVKRQPLEVRRQLDELIKLKHYESGQSLSATERSAEGLRRLLLALVKDVRVVLIDLSWQLVLLRRAKADSRVAEALARETILIHAPLANRLGIWQLKWELEDLSFRYQEPEQYRRIARLVAEHRDERERFINEFMDKLSETLATAGLPAEVKGRPKHIYSIWKKMQRKGLDFHQLFDVRAVRVLVDDLPACYSALGLVHTRCGNRYQVNLTTTLRHRRAITTSPCTPPWLIREGRAVEVQIRTYQMHEHAELGVAAHWRYKEGGPIRPGHSTTRSPSCANCWNPRMKTWMIKSLLDSFQSATTEDRVYVLTPKRSGGGFGGRVQPCSILPITYTPRLDTAASGAKVNGRIVPLDAKLLIPVTAWKF